MKRKLLIFVCIFILTLTTSFFVYVENYYTINDKDIIDYINEEAKIIDDNLYFDVQNSSEIGFIIYPGAKVEEDAYAGIAKELVDNGYTAVVASFPFRFAFFDKNVADDIIENRPEIKKWIIIGHSLGGAMASSYIENTDKYIVGIVYLGSYPATQIDIKSVYVYGENDLILNKNKIPTTKDVYEIKGGNHAGFAYYGSQKGDGELEISREDQIKETVEIIISNFE
ncbi:MAG: alpha/beta hydrolase [Bacilli bacterium]